jgi:DNA ligase (NAD+)
MNILQVPSVPKTLTVSGEFPVSEFVEVRGEVYISDSDFDSINSDRVSLGLVPYSTTRNAASGNLRRLGNDGNVLEKLKFFAYNIQFSSRGLTTDAVIEESMLDQQKALHALKQLQFQVADFAGEAYSVSFEKCFEILRQIESPGQSKEQISEKKLLLQNEKARLADSLFAMCDISPALRARLGFATDGVVVKVNSYSLQSTLGVGPRTPKWAVAYKFPSVEGRTRLIDIKVQVGRTGVLTPVAILEPIVLGGVTIERATLHNQDEINRLRLIPGKIVRVIRSGDVIPKILGCVSEGIDKINEGEEYTPYSLPSTCPACGARTAKETIGTSTSREADVEVDGVIVRCTNGLLCSAQAIEGMKHFCSRDAVDIKGFGNATIEELYTSGFIASLADIYRLQQRNEARADEDKLVSI